MNPTPSAHDRELRSYAELGPLIVFGVTSVYPVSGLCLVECLGIVPRMAGSVLLSAEFQIADRQKPQAG